MPIFAFLKVLFMSSDKMFPQNINSQEQQPQCAARIAASQSRFL